MLQSIEFDCVVIKNNFHSMKIERKEINKIIWRDKVEAKERKTINGLRHEDHIFSLFP